MLKRALTVAALLAASTFNGGVAGSLAQAESAPAASRAPAQQGRGPIIIVLPKCYRKVCNPVVVCDGGFCRIDTECVTVEVPCPVIPA